MEAELDALAGAGAVFKAVRGEYGSGMTFFTRHLAERALRRGFAASEVQVSETQTPLHRLETVYRRFSESLRTASIRPSALRQVLDAWLFTLEEDALTADPGLAAGGSTALGAAADEVDAGRFPGLYLVITGTPAFFEGRSGIARLAPLEQRLATDFTTDPRFDNPRAVQVRLPGFDRARLLELGVKVRELYAGGSAAPDRVRATVDDACLGSLANSVTGALGGRIGVAPRIFVKKLVGDVLDRVDQFEDFDPRLAGRGEPFPGIWTPSLHK